MLKTQIMLKSQILKGCYVGKIFMILIKEEIDKLNSLDLRSDLENNNIFNTYLKPCGYVGNRPSDFKGEYHEDDTWAIDCNISDDESVVCSYLYTSELEYIEDVELISNIFIIHQNYDIEYRTLSRLEDEFPKNSQHKAAKYIHQRMDEILKLLNI